MTPLEMRKIIRELALVFYLSVFLLFNSCISYQRVVTKSFDVKRDWPVIQVTLNGKPAYFLIDTGSNDTLLDSTDAKEYGFKLLEYGRVNVGIGGYSFSPFVDSATITVGNEILRADYTAQDLSAVFTGYTRMTNRNLVGIIGNDILQNHNVKIDYATLSITFSNFTKHK